MTHNSAKSALALQPQRSRSFQRSAAPSPESVKQRAGADESDSLYSQSGNESDVSSGSFCNPGAAFGRDYYADCVVTHDDVAPMPSFLIPRKPLAKPAPVLNPQPAPPRPVRRLPGQLLQLQILEAPILAALVCKDIQFYRLDSAGKHVRYGGRVLSHQAGSRPVGILQHRDGTAELLHNWVCGSSWTRVDARPPIAVEWSLYAALLTKSGLLHADSDPAHVYAAVGELRGAVLAQTKLRMAAPAV